MNWDRVFVVTTFFSDLVSQANADQSPGNILKCDLTPYCLDAVICLLIIENDDIQHKNPVGICSRVPPSALNYVFFEFFYYIFFASFLI